MKTWHAPFIGAAAALLLGSGVAAAVDEVSIDTSPAAGPTGALTTNVWTDMNARFRTETVQYQAGADLAVGDIFVDRGYGRVNGFTDSNGDPAGGSLANAINNLDVGLDVAWRDLTGQVTGVTPLGTGNTQVATQYQSSAPFEFFYSDPRTSVDANDVDGSITDIQGETKVLELALTGGTGDLQFDSNGNFEGGDFSLEFEVTEALAGFWNNETNNEDFADILIGDSFIISFATAGTVAQPAPEQSEDLPDGFAGSVNGQDFAFAVVSSHDGSFRFQVPEPGTLALMGLSLVILAGVATGGFRRRSNGAV